VINGRNNSINTQSFTAENNSTTTISAGYTAQRAEYHNITVQGDLIASYKFKWIDTSTLLGYNYRDSVTVSDTYAGVPTAPYNIADLTAIEASGDAASFWSSRVVNAARSAYTVARPYNLGAYGEEDLGLFHDRIILNGSVRRDHDHTETDNLITGKESSSSDTQLTSYRFGVTGKITDHLAAYAVESLQNDPATTYAMYNGLLAGDPRNGTFFTVSPSEKLYEYGLKGELFNGRVSFSADHWEMNKTGAVVNLLQQGISQGQAVSYGIQTVLQGASSHGYEFSFYGDLSSRLSLVANYTRMYTGQQNTADPGNPGDRTALQYAPIWNYNVFAKYVLWQAEHQQFYVKGGVQGIGPFWAQATLSTGAALIYIPHSQKSLDAGGGYKWRNYTVDVMVTNLDDDPFLVTRDQAPRTYRFSFSAHF
jgi:hypothetical protein